MWWTILWWVLGIYTVCALAALGCIWRDYALHVREERQQADNFLED